MKTGNGERIRYGIMRADRRLVCPLCGQEQRAINREAEIHDLLYLCKRCRCNFWVNIAPKAREAVV